MPAAEVKTAPRAEISAPKVKYLAGEDPVFAKQRGWPVNFPAPLPGSILPRKRIVAYYGNPLSKRMGALGEYPKDDHTKGHPSGYLRRTFNLFANVRNKNGQIVKDLTKDDFLLDEDGRAQVISYFSQESDLPLTLGLLVDTSGSQRRHPAKDHLPGEG